MKIKATISIENAGPDHINFASPSGMEGFKVDFFSEKTDSPLCSFLFLPWQDLYAKTDSGRSMVISEVELLTVTSSALVYRVSEAVGLNDDEQKVLDRIKTYMDKAIVYKTNNKPIAIKDEISLSTDHQVMTYNEFRHYIELSIAESGSGKAKADVLSDLFPGKMILLHCLPDIGPVRTNWICPARGSQTDDLLRIQQILVDDFSV